MQNEMNRVVASFVAEVREIARQAARSQLDEAFGSRPSVRRVAGSASRSKGAKRTQADLEKLSEQFFEFVKANPGLRIEQINAKLGTSTKDLQLPIRKMVASGELKVKGKKRSTTYTAGARKKD